jgi:hypothetical protein
MKKSSLQSVLNSFVSRVKGQTKNQNLQKLSKCFKNQQKHQINLKKLHCHENQWKNALFTVI